MRLGCDKIRTCAMFTGSSPRLGSDRMDRLALYPGTFDPVTLGHLDVLRRALRLFDRVEVTVATNIAKRTLFSDDERADLIRASIADWPVEERERVDVTAFEGLVVEHARRRGAAPINEYAAGRHVGIENRKPVDAV